MSAERLMVERAAESVARVAVNDAAFLTTSDPLSLIGPHIGEMEHVNLAQVAVLLLQRFHSTAASGPGVPQLAPLAAAAEKLVLPALERLERCIAQRPAFQSAFSLSPLLSRAVVLGAQCCCLVVRDLADCVAASLPLTRSLTLLAQVISVAVLDRAEHFRPMDSSSIFRAHQSFTTDHAEICQALAALPGPSPNAAPQEEGPGVAQADALSLAVADAPADHAEGSCPRPAQRTLAPAPEIPAHGWRNVEMRQFWEAKCTLKYGSVVPVDVLALLLLRAAGHVTELPNREAMMRRLNSLSGKDPGKVSEQELDSCSAEVRRCGGLKAWVGAVLFGGGAAPERAPPPSTAGRPPVGSAFASTWGSSVATPRGLLSAGGASTMPLSARSFQGSTSASTATSASRQGRKPFALSASFGRRSTSGESNPLHDSVERNLLKNTQHLILGSKSSVDARHGTFNETPLHTAAVQDDKHAPLATLLLDHGASANAEDKNLATPLHVAASTGHGEVARRLVERGADVRKKDRWCATALHKAAASGQAEMVNLLLHNGAAADAADDWGSTPLHRAVARGQLAVAEQLLANGAVDVNAEDRRGDRPLHLAARRGDYALVKLLLEHGSSATARSRGVGNTPEDYARERGHTDIVTLLAHRHEWVIVRPPAGALVAAA